MQKTHASLWIRLKNAWRGIIFFLSEEIEYWIAILLVALIGGLVFLASPTKTELIFLLLALSIGVLLGMFNFIVEELCDLYSTEYNPRIKKIKDVAAGACMFYIASLLVLYILIVL